MFSRMKCPGGQGGLECYEKFGLIKVFSIGEELIKTDKILVVSKYISPTLLTNIIA